MRPPWPDYRVSAEIFGCRNFVQHRCQPEPALSEAEGGPPDAGLRLARLLRNRPEPNEEEVRLQKITTFLTFKDRAEEAVQYYTSIFSDSKILSTTRSGDAGPGPKGSGTFRLAGQEFMALNGGPSFQFSQGISLLVNCDTQEEIDELWEKLSEGGQKIECGWLTDKFGVSWQIVPSILGKLMTDKDPQKSQRVLQAVLQMKKLDIAKLQAAHDGKETS
jgi:predicted 3-demethylubiquinone-9 3-methyltransferase (glyoxalase superfamily)